MRFSSLLLGSILSVSLTAAEPQSELGKISEAFGHLIGKNMDTIGVEFDLDLVLKGLKDAVAGKDSPMSEEECITAISNAQEVAFKLKAEANLKNAEDFLKGNAGHKNVISLEEGKIQYKVEKRGKGAEVAPHSSPLIHYVGKYLDGTVFGQSSEGETISLDTTIQGFQKGLVGMKEGETRTLYIHPEYGYGTRGYLAPNSLLTFEIEVVKADTPKEEPAEGLILESDHVDTQATEKNAHNLR
jgi:peptidylprolyl isomerase